MENNNIKNITTEQAPEKNLSVKRLVVGGVIVLFAITLLSLLLVFTCVIKLSPNGLEVQRSGSGIEIVKYTGSEKNVEIPDLINGFEVISIKEKAFYNNDTVENVQLPKTLKEVGSYSFANCSKLKEVKFSSVCTNFGNNVFENSSVKKVSLPTDLQKISKAMFKNCKNITEVSFPDKLLFIDDEAFYGCISLTKMTIGEGIRKIGDNAFAQEQPDFMLCSVVGSIVEDYARKNSLEYAPCNEYYEVYTKYPVYVGNNTYSSVNVSNGRNGILSFLPYESGYYRVTLKGENVDFDINKATKKTQKLSTIKNNPNDYFAYFEKGKEYFLAISAGEESNFQVNIEKTDKKIVSMYQQGEKLYLGEDVYEISKGTELKTEHYNSASTIATVSKDNIISKVLDYYVEGNNKIWYQISTKIGSKENSLWFKG